MNTALGPANSATRETLRRIKLLSLDVDGILTDGGIYYSDDGNSYRKFNAKDGLGVTRLVESGIVVAIISAGAPGAIEHRAKRMGVQHVFTDVHDKLSIMQNLCGQLGIDITNVAHMGDDIPDLPMMKAVGGVVTLTAIWPACGRRRRRLCNGRHLPPLSHRVAAELAECSAGDQMALDVEEVVDGRMDGEEPLRGRGRFEPLHLSLSSSHRLM